MTHFEITRKRIGNMPADEGGVVKVVATREEADAWIAAQSNPDRFFVRETPA